ncbi:MAG TPA: SMP-30/gluconolactonase/LRE family protein [Chryseosolibacter sp.]
MKNIPFAVIVITLLFAVSCEVSEKTGTFGSIESLDPALDSLINPLAKLEILSEGGYEWTEGPLWIESEKMLLFSDVPTNIVYKWTEKDSIEVFLNPSGYTGKAESKSQEQGSNGLALDRQGNLILCQHGDRRLAAMSAPLKTPQAVFSTLADSYNGKKFNSPNDVVVRGNGDYFFTDPPYGLPKDLAQEIPFQGVYKLSDGTVSLLVDSLTRPNGIAFMPEERTIIIANSDPEKAIWYAYDLLKNDSVENGRIFHDATEAAKKEAGLPDGLKIDRQGNVFATGPGGIWIFNREGKVLGKIKIPVATANCAFSEDEKTLYITADSYLVRLRMRE